MFLICSGMGNLVNTLGAAGRRNMILRAECGCGNIRYFRARDLAQHFGSGRDPLALKFSCEKCKPKVEVTLHDLDYDRMPKLSVWRPHRRDDSTVWMQERLR